MRQVRLWSDLLMDMAERFFVYGHGSPIIHKGVVSLCGECKVR